MKRKIIGAMLALCIILSCAFVFSACGDTSNGGITEDEWNSELNLMSLTKYSFTVFDGKADNEIKFDGINFSHAIKMPDSEEPVNEMRLVLDGDKYIRYDLAEDGYWDKSEVSLRDFASEISTITAQYMLNYAELFKYGEIPYNEGTKQFEANEYTYNIEGFVGEFEKSFYNVKIAFNEDKKVSLIEYSDSYMEQTYLHFSHDSFVIEAPSVERPVGPMTEEDMWNEALDLSVLDNVTIVQKQGDSTISTFLWDGTNLYVEMQGVSILVEKDGDSYYTYTKIGTNAAWGERTTSDEDTYNAYINAYLQNSEIYHYEDFSYNASSGKYEADSIEQTGDGVTVVVNNVKISFTDGKPDTISYEYSGNTTVMTYSYSDVTIEIPVSNQ
ncbi:MAG: hypothetical protein IJ309_01365 [Clostridia bacterium]|nr:hypothetical protein [Clostridia bacterium]